MNTLPPRLQELTQWFLHTHPLIDVGCDHGWLPILSLRSRKVSSAIAVDRAAAPLALAKKHGEGIHGLKIVQSDGLDQIEVPMGSVVSIAGMGGMQMCTILKRAPLARIQRIVVQPNRDGHHLRAWLAQAGWHTKEATVIQEKGRYFLSWCAQRGEGELGENGWHWNESWFTTHPSPQWYHWLMQRQTQIETTVHKHGRSASLTQEFHTLEKLLALRV